MRLLTALLVTALLLTTSLARTASAADAPAFIWFEGESATQHNFPRGAPFGPQTFRESADQLSGGDWLNMGAKAGAQPFFATWTVDVPADGDYAFWTRKFWKHGPFRWRFDSQPADQWQTCGPDVALADETPLKKFVSANWVHLGSVNLKQGKQTLRIELTAAAGKDISAAFDCFVLSRSAFVPRGKLKPGEKIGKADEGFFAFEPDIDPFKPDALLDLRSMNEPTAGQNGFIKRNGKDLVLGDGKPVKFWAVNLSLENAKRDRPSVDYLARKLAKLGVNMVRFHSAMWDEKDLSRIDAEKLDALHYLVAAMKKEGIYTALSFFFPVWADGQKLGLDGFDTHANKKPFALMYFDPKLQELHRGWCRQLLAAQNPYTGKSLASEPAVGMVEIINEDSLFFWTLNKQNLPPVQWGRLEDLFNQWLVKKHGSLEGAFVAWKGASERGDNRPHRAALGEAFTMTSNAVKANEGKRLRAGDQVQFLAELQRGYYDRTTQFLKNDLKVGSPIIASNWTTADPALLGPVERWTYTPGDVIDAHGYFEPEHKGEAASYSVRVGHTVVERSAVKNPGLLPLRFQQVENYPMFISEIGFTQPNRYRADGVFLAATTGATQGIDGIAHFAVNSNYLTDSAIGKFQVASPMQVGAFPAAAVMYRKGLVREAEPAVYQVSPVADLWKLTGEGGFSADALDAFRAADIPRTGTITAPVGKVDGLTPYVGPVVRGFEQPASSSRQKNVPQFISREKKSLASLTNEFQWDYNSGVAVIDAPAAQGVAGFVGASQPVVTRNATIDLKNEFGTVTVVSLDDKPIADSAKVLVQVMTQEQPLGYRVENNVITNLGSAPFGVRKAAGSVKLRFTGDAAKATVTPIDWNGLPITPAIEAKVEASAVSFELSPDVMYYLIRR